MNKENLFLKIITVVVISITLFITGCATLSVKERSELIAMKTNEPPIYVEEKTPSTAALLGILPGGGSFYTRQWGLGILDLLLWPISVLWDPFVGYEGAQAINYEETRSLAKNKKKKEMDVLEEKKLRKEIAEEQYTIEKTIIERRYTFNYNN